MPGARNLSGFNLSPAIARLHERTERGDGCWIYTGPTRKGYGQVAVAPGVSVQAHRLALIAAGVEIAPEQDACHHCDNPPCVNPAHLYAGSHAQNMRDKKNRGRCNTPFGERVPASKLTALDVQRIRVRRATGESMRSLAWTFGVTVPTISLVVNRKLWKEVA